MKKMANLFSPKSYLTIAVVSGLIMAGCNNNDYEKAGETTVVNNDSMTMGHDTSMQSSNMIVNTDSPALNTTATTATTTSVTGKDSLTMPAKNTGAKKGKVSIVMTAPVIDKTVKMEMDKEGFYTNTEVLPAYPGGQKALERFFEDNIQYPEAATENDAQGTVKLSFAVDENGKIYQPVATGNKIGYGLEEEAIRVFNKMPKWTPGKIKGKNVKARFTLPINFQLY